MIDKKLAINLLAQGINTSQVAQTVGCDASYISQLREECKEDIEAAKDTQTASDIAFDSRLADAESVALDRVSRNLPFANMGQALSAFRILNSARRRKDGPVTPQGVTVNVTLTLPATTAPRYVQNAQSEIVEVDGVTLVSATPASLNKLLETKTGKPMTAAITDQDKATVRLSGLTQLPSRAPRKAPAALSVDML